MDRKRRTKKPNTKGTKTRGDAGSSDPVSNVIEFAPARETPEEKPEKKEKKERRKKAGTKRKEAERRREEEEMVRTAEVSAGGRRKTRSEIRRAKTRIKVLTAILLVILFGIIGFISLKVLFVVRRFEVKGTERYTDEEILAFCSIPLDMNIFDVDVDVYAESLPENFTYIDSAKVKRKLPDKIQINIVDCVPTYFSVNDTEEVTYNIYSQNFKYLTIRASRPETLMCIGTDMEDEQSFNTTKELIKILRAKGYENVTEIKVDEDGIFFIYDDRVKVLLGNMLDIEYKLKMTFHVLEKEISPNERGTVDATKTGQAVYNMEI